MSVPEGWQSSTVAECLDIRNNLRAPINTDERAKIQGIYPYYGPTGILDYIDSYRLDGEFVTIGEDGDHFLKYRDRPMTLLVSGKFNVNNHAHVIASTNRCEASWFANFYMHRELTPYLTRQGAGRYKLTKAALEKLPILLPPLPEQRRIAAILSQWDDSLSILAKLIEAKRQQKRGLAEQLLTGKRRLKGFEGEWEEKSLGDIAKPSSKKYDPKTSPDLPCIELEHLQSGTGKILGFTRSKQQASTKNLFGPDNVLFGKLRPYLEKYAFPKSIGVCSSEIWVFQMNECAYPDYFFQLIQTKIFLDVANKASGSKMPRADWRLMQETVFSLPTLPEQRAIASILSTLDEEITALTALKAKVQEQKRGLMDALLTGQVRVRVDELSVAG